MSYFNDKLVEGLFTGNYICNECGSKMEFEDEEVRDVLVCPKCGHSVDLDRYGSEDEEDIYGEEVIYPEDLWSDEEDDININLYNSEDEE